MSEDIQTVWYLSTVGNGSKRIFKQLKRTTIVLLSIPKICNLLTNEPNLRYCSTILYGVSLLLHLKTEYLLGDVLSINNRIKLSSVSSSNTVELPAASSFRFLRDDPQFMVDDFGGDDFVFENSGILYDSSGPTITEIIMPDVSLGGDIDLNDGGIDNAHPGLEPLTFDFELDIDISEAAHTTEMSIASTPPLPTPSTPPAAPPNPRKRKVVLDDVLVMAESEYVNFRDNYDAIMELSLSQKTKTISASNVLTSVVASGAPVAPQTPEFGRLTPEIGRRLSESNRSQFNGSEITFDDYAAPPDDFHLSFGSQDFGDGGSETRNEPTDSNRDTEVEVEGPHMIRFYNYLQNMDRNSIQLVHEDYGDLQRIKFSAVCPPHCPKPLAAKSFLTTLELAHNARVHVDGPQSLELSTADDIEIILRGSRY